MPLINWSDPALQRAIRIKVDSDRGDPFLYQRIISHLVNGIIKPEELIKEAK